MENLNRRSALALGLTAAAAAVPLVASMSPAKAAMYGPDVGKEIMPGIRQVDIGKFSVNFGNYKSAVVTDWVIAPGHGFPEDTMKNDSVCQIVEGELKITHDGKTFVAKTGHLFSCTIGSTETDDNEGSVAAIMRSIDLFST
jgi:quercetin dioxygenase-like cupin family protein